MTQTLRVCTRSAYSGENSKRAFQMQFRRWNFPNKQKPAHGDERLVARVKELWEKNVAQRDMQTVLNQEGFEIKPRELMRVRMRNRWLLRLPKGTKEKASDRDDEVESLDGSSTVDGDSAQPLEYEHDTASQPAQEPVHRSPPRPQAPSQLPLEIQSGPARVVADSEGKPKRKRRKRARGSADDPASGARFQSEMTIDESRLILDLDTKTYRDIRTVFQNICQDGGVFKKTLAGPERWEGAKARLIREVPALQTAMLMTKDDMESKSLALEVICADVTKRMRNLEVRMTLADARNTLGINPEESRQVRTALHQVLREAKFTCKSDATPEQWEATKRRWGEESPLVQKILNEEGREPDGPNKMHALEFLAKDIMKRLRDDRVRKDPQRLRILQPSAASRSHDAQSISLSQTQSSPSSNPMDLGDSIGGSNFDALSEVSGPSQMAFGSPNTSMTSHMPMALSSQESSLSSSSDGLPQPPRVLGSSMPGGLPLDPQMGSSLLLQPNAQTAFMGQPYVQQQFAAATPPAPVFHPVPSVPTAYAVYLRLHPSSTFVTHTTLWITTITSQSLDELRQAAVDKFPDAACIRVQGILRDGKAGEVPLQIEQDEELSAYLTHLQGGTPTFSVQLVWKN